MNDNPMLTLGRMAMADRYHYVLDGHEPKPVDLMTWARWFEKHENRRVAKWEEGGIEVSTVFIGIDHSFGDGPPLLFETMVFGGPLADEQERYSTWAEAESGHAAMVERVRAALRRSEQ